MTSFFYDSFFSLLFFLLPGFCIGVLYDWFRIARLSRTNENEQNLTVRIQAHFFPETPIRTRTRHADSILIFWEDIVFCVIAALIEILMFFYINNGVIRIYAILISIIGFFLYYHTIGHFMMHFARRLIKLARTVLYVFLVMLMTIPISVLKAFHKKM